MKQKLLIVAVLLTAAPSHASPYVRLMDPHHVQQSAAFLVDPFGAHPLAQVTDVAVLTHSTEDGTIMPAFCRSTWCPPENWAPLEFGGGGSARVVGGRLEGSAVVHAGTSVNIAPQLGALLLAKVDAGSPAPLRAVKTAMLNVNGQGVRLGVGLAGNVIKDGVFQSAREAFPGAGLGAILKNATRITVGYSWTWGQ